MRMRSAALKRPRADERVRGAVPLLTRPSSILLLLFLVNAVNFFDRQILAAVAEPIRREWHLSDAQLGWLGTAFTLLYAVVGIPMGRLADSRSRVRLLAAGVTFWSALTCASGLARGFWSLFAARLGVGVGEAVCAPASTSLIGDLFPARARARAMSIFMFGLPAGLALSYIVSGAIAQHFGWRAAFLVAGLPGLLLGLVALRLREPPRTAAAGMKPSRTLLDPAFWWIVLSGALHNFNMYALTFFLPAFLVRYHGASVQAAGFLCGVVVGVVGGIGMLCAGWVADLRFKPEAGDRLKAAALAIACSVPALYAALGQPQGALRFAIPLFGCAFFFLYAYYGIAYAAIQDIVAPARMDTALAVYLFALYLMGASLGPAGMGWLSDFFAGTETQADGSAAGLRLALHAVPAVGILLSAVLLIAARSAQRRGKAAGAGTTGPPRPGRLREP